MPRGAVLVDVGHPAHVHVFRNVLRLLEERDIPFFVTARHKEVSLRLLEAFGIPYQEVGGHYLGLWRKGLHTAGRIQGIARAMRVHSVRVGMGVHNPYVAAAGSLVRVRTAILVDSEPVRYDRWLTYPLASYLLTPRGFWGDLGRKHVRFDGFKELAYLHPRYFHPDGQVLRNAGLDVDERYFLVRFVAWAAEHDIGQRGLSLDQKRRLVATLSRHGRVYISSEAPLPDDLSPYGLALPPELIHHALAFASLLFSESQTMTTEAALLGTPVVQCNTLVGTMSNFSELQDRYGLIQATRDAARAMVLAESTASDPAAKRAAQAGAARLISEKIDVAEYLANVADAVLAGRSLPSGLKVG